MKILITSKVAQQFIFQNLIQSFYLVVGSNLYEDHGSCTAWGSKHFITFDNRAFTFTGKGTYTLVQDCSGSPQATYQVFINQTYSCTADSGCKAALKVSSYPIFFRTDYM